MALMNRQLNDGLETLFMVPAGGLTYISSSLVREVAQLRGRRDPAGASPRGRRVAGPVRPVSGLEQVVERARAHPARVVLVAGGDPAVGRAAELLSAAAGAAVTVVGDGGIVPADDPRLGRIAALLRDRWPERVRDGIHALDLAADPLLFAAGLLLSGEAAICVAAGSTPPDAVEDGYRWILGADRATMGRGAIRYVVAADGRLLTTGTPDTAGPLDAKGVAQLALMAARHRGRAVGDEPRVAFLVPPPSVDASHADAEVAVAELRSLAPGLAGSVEWSWPAVDGPGPRFRTRPNVLILPDPISGHLAHALLRDAGRVQVWGPLFPADRWAVAGISEGSSAEDIAAVATVAAAGLAGV